MLHDIAACLTAICLFPLFLLVPGYALAFLTDLFDFRRRTFAFQMALSIPLSIAICPIVTYFAARFGSMTVVWALYAVSWLLCPSGRSPPPKSLAPYTRIVCILFAAWAAIAIFSLIDLQIGDRAWYPSAAFDYSIRTQFIHSLGATGIPPGQPILLSRATRAAAVSLLLVDPLRAGGPRRRSLVTARHAWIAGTVWCGFGFMATVALYFRLFAYKGPESFRRRALTGILLLTVTGLDILPTAILWALQAAGMHAVRPAMEWWNEQVDGFVYTALWESHYLSGLIACLTAFLILWAASASEGYARRLRVPCLPPSPGQHLRVGDLRGVGVRRFPDRVDALRAGQPAQREFALLVATGILGLAFATPFAQSLRGPALRRASSPVVDPPILADRWTVSRRRPRQGLDGRHRQRALTTSQLFPRAGIIL